MLNKICNKCGIEKSIEDFHKNKKGKFGRVETCKSCKVLINKHYHISYANKIHVIKNEETTKICTKCNLEKNLSEYSKSNASKVGIRSYCKACGNSSCRKRYIKNRDYHLNRRKKYYTKNKKRINQINGKKKVEARRIDPLKRFVHNFKNSIVKYIKKYKGIKKCKTIDLLGTDIISLRKHLESKFKEGMSWDNHGLYGWHIDHILPCASFDLTKEEDQRRCFHYTNLQPLWAEDNLKKSDKIILGDNCDDFSN